MSSSPPTDAPARRGWDPAGWSLRARLVAVMVALLAVLGLVVGATAEVYLHKTLYDRVDAQVQEVSNRAFPDQPNRSFPDQRDGRRAWFIDMPPPGASVDWIVVRFTGPASFDGGLVTIRQADDQYGSRYGYDSDLPRSALTELAGLPPDGRIGQIDLGDLGQYRVVTTTRSDGTVVVSAAPLTQTQQTLMQIAVVTGVAVLLALIIAGWAGAAIIRRNLRPLERVAATATRVSELRLDRGEVHLAQRVPPADTDAHTEVGQVGAALNRLLDHVGSALEARHRSEMQVRQFVADASHELRTPLAAIRGYAELSRRSRHPVPDEVGHVLRRVESEAQRMTTLVEDLLLLARLDAGRPLAHDPVDLTVLVVDAVSDAHAAGPRHDWQLDLPAEPVTVTGDGARLHQVLANLLANARTHTPEGTTVTVGVRSTGDEAVLTVTDGGPGIAAELQPHIFERFARGDSSRSRAAGSTGLGLSIVHAVVSAHGGTVAVTSEPGRTVFTVRLPIGAARPPAAAPAAEMARP